MDLVSRPISKMISAPLNPLTPGTILNGHYQLGRVLGHGGFGITYEAQDTRSGRGVVVKELAPVGSVRDEDGMMSFLNLGPTALHRLRSQFEEEGRVLQRLRIPGIVSGLDQFQENGTGYLVMERIEGAVSLHTLAQSEGRMSAEAVEEIIDQILDALEPLHARGLIHRDLKPSNILIDPSGKIWLIDLGSVRQWTADLTVRHTVLFTPGFAPLEQLTENARRGPGTDLYGVAATAFYLLTGIPPAAPGEVPIPLTDIRKDLPDSLFAAVEAGLALRLDDRPASVDQFRLLLGRTSGTSADLGWQEMDRMLKEVRHLHFGKFECPGCGDVLSETKPTKPGICIVCREGKLAAIPFDQTQCAACGNGILRKLSNRDPLIFSPQSGRVRLQKGGARLPWSPKLWVCPESDESFRADRDGLTRLSDNLFATLHEWRELSGRSEVVYECEACHAEFDEQRDGRWKQILPTPKLSEYVTLYPEEWARVAKGRDPGSGNAFCERCHAEYFWEADSLTLLSADRDPFRILERYQGALITVEEARWIAAGKSSGSPGLTCVKCPTEFDREESGYRLARTSDVKGKSAVGQLQVFEDWHRVFRGLPLRAEQDAFEEDFLRALAIAYRAGEIETDPIWKSKATFAGKVGTLILREAGFEFGGLLLKDRIPLREIQLVNTSDDHLLVLETQEVLEFEVTPMHLTLNLESGATILELTVEDLADRLRNLKKHRVPEEIFRNPESLA